ncbi:hypothetical protein L484_021293 [Morus notabilis]|uniref:Uncharacterized protein n=1 Tax=Morus notabilis TaxID=981085 RepID=W9SG52_9ROSA|nr:hypothetical protein L484_021293 [Morus notabilis]
MTRKQQKTQDRQIERANRNNAKCENEITTKIKLETKNAQTCCLVKITGTAAQRRLEKTKSNEKENDEIDPPTREPIQAQLQKIHTGEDLR